MKYFPLVWAALWRKKVRTILTLLSVSVAFLLFGLLQGINAGFDNLVASSSLNRILTFSGGSLPIPISALERIERIPGVTHVAYVGMPLVAEYQQPQNFVVGRPVEVQRWFEAHPELQTPDAQKNLLIETRTGALVGKTLADKYGWQVGDTIPLTSSRTRRTDGSLDWTFEIVGFYEAPTRVMVENSFLFNYDYFDEARASDNGTVVQYVVTIEDPSQTAEITEVIDSLFDNSPNQTRSMSEQEAAETQLQQIGDLNYIITAVVGAAFFTLLFLTGNTMMQSVRERTTEFGVLKALGFTDTAVIASVVSESVLLCGLGAAIGIGGTALLFPIVSSGLPSAGSGLSGSVIIYSTVLAIVVAAASGVPPAWRASRLAVVDALLGR